jgi:hypothetical protein
MAVDPENPRRFLRSTKWKKATEGFFHGQLVLDFLIVCVRYEIVLRTKPPVWTCRHEPPLSARWHGSCVRKQGIPPWIPQQIVGTP